MTSEQLQIFLAVWRCQSFTSASAELDLAPSSVSRAVAALEAELGARLFHRTTRAMHPTEAGQRLFEKANALIENWEALQASIGGEDREPRGRLRVTASIAFAQTIIAPMLERFQAHCPDIQVEMILSDERIDLIKNQIDVAIRHGEMDDSSLLARRLLSAQYKLVASPKLIARQPPLINPADLSGRPLVSFSFAGFRREWIFSRKGQDTPLSIDPAVSASNALVVREAILSGAGYGLLANWMISDELAAGRLVEVLPDWQARGEAQASEVWLIHPTSRLIMPKARAFADFLVSEVTPFR
ncbi:MAG: LysR family transcriptional regulator [Pseudomonadota bacterium]